MRKLKRTICLIAVVVMVFSMTTVTADASAKKKGGNMKIKTVSVSCSTVKVSCKARVGVTGYQVFVSKKKNRGFALASEGVSNVQKVDGLATGKTYYFKMRTYTDVNGSRSYSKYSRIGKAKCKLKLPKISAWTDSCYEGFINFSGCNGPEGYKVYRSKYKNKKFKLIATVPGSSNVYRDAGLDQNKKYYYKVKAYNGKTVTRFSKVKSLKTTVRPDGNAAAYDPANCQRLPDNALTGRRIFFLGSSITYGSGSGGYSFVDYIAKRDGAIVGKEAVSGTTMTGVPGSRDNSFVNRNSRLVGGEAPDIFACQLSLNDAFQGKQLGEVKGLITDPETGEIDLTKYDTKTVCGAIDYITAFAKKNWPDCQVVFFTVRNSGNQAYSNMRSALFASKHKWESDEDGNIMEIIDMWSESRLTNLRGNPYILYMNDANHPTKAGYLEIWTPIFENNLTYYMPKPKSDTTGEDDQAENEDEINEQEDNAVQ